MYDNRINGPSRIIIKGLKEPVEETSDTLLEEEPPTIHFSKEMIWALLTSGVDFSRTNS